MKKKFNVISSIICIICIFSLGFNSQAQTANSSISKNLLNKIYQKDKSYSQNNVEIISNDFDADGSNEYFFVFTKKDALNNDDILNYCADIWFGDGTNVSRVVKWQYILPDTFGSIKLNGKNYFRYDLAYVTDNQTILLGAVNDKCVESFPAYGSAEFGSDNKFTVSRSSYDMVYSKSEKYSLGHTWKDYYFYIDSNGFHEYTARQISNKDFLKYSNADSIIKNLNKEFYKENTKITYQFLKRSNGLLHINIACETEDSISYNYCTYAINKDNKLVIKDSGQGKYLLAISKK